MAESIKYGEQIDDPRQQGKVRHKRSDIIRLVSLGTLTDNWAKIALFGRRCRKQLDHYPSLKARCALP